MTRSLEEIYNDNKDLIDNTINFIPIASTIKDGYDFYKNPNWENGINLALSLSSDLIGAKFLGGALKTYKAVKKANKAKKLIEGQAKEMKLVNRSLKNAGQPQKYSNKRIKLQEDIESKIKYDNPIKSAIKDSFIKYIALDFPTNSIQFVNNNK